MSKWSLMLLGLALTFGVTACSTPATEPETVDEAPVEEVAAATPVEEVTEEAPVEEAAEEDADAEAAAPANVIDRQAKVTSVNRPGDAAFDTMTVDNGDGVQGTTFAPDADDPDVGIVAGTTYNMFMITQPDDTQAFIVWSPDEPIWQDLLKTASAVVAGIGSPGPNTLMRGDDVQISVQEAQEGGIDVTLDVYRDGSAVATFSFVVDGEYPAREGAEAALCSPTDEGAEVEIKIENKGPFTVFVHWQDFDCNAVEVAVLAPDEEHSETTTVGHVFTAGGHGYDHGTYVVPDGGGTWTITGPTDYAGDDSG